MCMQSKALLCMLCLFKNKAAAMSSSITLVLLLLLMLMVVMMLKYSSICLIQQHDDSTLVHKPSSCLVLPWERRRLCFFEPEAGYSLLCMLVHFIFWFTCEFCCGLGRY